ncbi:EAL domain-containing protein [Massilia sp. CMS3.1]|uniref:sensor domain-containing phosphodiesterase n=1 Tax=Massilia sp. CMS3.1 TaxID=3373083 RepID=UPI003EE612EB
MSELEKNQLLEQARLQSIVEYNILDSAPEAEFDDFTFLAANSFSVPVALIGFITEDRQWFKSKVGVTADQIPRAVSFCNLAIQGNDVLIVEDAQLDPRFSNNPLVTGEPRIRFYAGAPLISPEGHALGTLCVVDREPRKFSDTQKLTLAILAKQIMAQLELRKKNAALDNALAELRTQQSRLEESQARLSFAMESSGVGDWYMDLKTNIAKRSLQHDRCFGYTEAVATWGYDTFLSHVDARDRDRVDAAFQKARGGEGLYDVEFRVTWPDGSEHWLWSKGRFYFDQAQTPCRVGGIQTDITERKRAEAQLSQSQKNYQLLFENSMDAVLQTRIDGSIFSANPAACKLFGMTEAAFLLSNRSTLVAPDDVRLSAYLKTRAETGHAFGPLRLVRADGSQFEAEISSNIYIDAQGMPATSMVIRDITEQTQAQNDLEAANVQLAKYNEQLKMLAHFDSLTSLPNRVLLADRLDQALVLSQRTNDSVAVAFLDIDGFKAINDEHGHAIGDKLLVALARGMQLSLRDGDTLSRISGDEFVAVIGGLGGADDVIPFLSRLLAAVATPVTVGKICCAVTVSIGVTIYPRDRSDGDRLIRHADQAMYVAKQEGKNRYHLFDSEHDARVSYYQKSIAEIQHALTDGQLVLYYQPKVDLRTSAIAGVEALIRWQHPQRGLVLPGDFLPTIENHAISVTIGEWVISTALKQIAAWDTFGLKMPVSVNIGALQLQRGDFAERLTALFEANPEVPPRLLELEILESSAVRDISEVASVIKACQELDVQFALDDFGTGYSSLAYLKELPAHLIKIDRSFVRDMLFDQNDLAIIRGVIGLAKAFERIVIAEGVETDEHAAMLLELGCDLAQGYGIARPMPAATVQDWARNWCESIIAHGDVDVVVRN